MMNVLEVIGLAAGYRNLPVLREVSFGVAPGELWAILGPNGAGKSTLLRACLGLHPPQSGRIDVLGRPIADWTRRQLAQQMAWVPQGLHAGLGFTGLELVLMGRNPRLGVWGMPSRLDTTRALSLMAELGVEQVAQRSIDALSGGERRLLLVARALAQEPQILLLDEPTAFLDLKHQVEVLGRVKARVNRGLAALAVVHDVNHAAAFADKVLLLKGGRVLAWGSPESVMTTEVLEQLYELPIGSAHTREGQAVFAPRLEKPR